MSAPHVAWKIEGHGAELVCGPLAAYAGCGPEGTSFIPSRWHSQKLDSIDVLESHGPRQQSELLELADHYVRGADLVADFTPAGPHRIAPQIYWRAAFEPSTGAVRIELSLSVRTELLDSAPAWPVISFVMDSALFHTSSLTHPAFDDITAGGRTFQPGDSAEHLFVFRHQRFGLSYAQMVHPTDFVSAETTPDGKQPLFVESKLFPERMEKGVIRRGRICGWFLPVNNDLETAVRLARQFVDAPLPLTT